MNDKLIGFVAGGIYGAVATAYLMYKEGKHHGDEMYALGLDHGIKIEKIIRKCETELKEEE